MIGGEEEDIWWRAGCDELTIVEATSPPGFVEEVLGPPFCGIAEPAAEVEISIVLVEVALADWVEVGGETGGVEGLWETEGDPVDGGGDGSRAAGTEEDGD